MKNYTVRVYRAHPSNLDSISGIVEDIESGQIESFHRLEELHALLVCSVSRGQLELPNNKTKNLIEENVAVAV